MGFPIVFTHLALEDLERIVRKVAQVDTLAALGLGGHLVDAVESLRDQPYWGSALANRPEVRKLVCPPYLILYRVNEASDALEILRILDEARE